MTRDIARGHGFSDPITRTNALCRGGLVLMCSHVEGYIEDLGSVAINHIEQKGIPKVSLATKFKYHLSQDLIRGINTSTDPSVIAERLQELLERDGHIWDSSDHFAPPLPVDTFVGNFATPNHRAIRRFFGRFGYQEFHTDLNKHLLQNSAPCINMVNQLVDQRNKIAHGDAVTAGSPSDLEAMFRLVKLYCRGTDKVVGDWFRDQGCSIR